MHLYFPQRLIGHSKSTYLQMHFHVAESLVLLELCSPQAATQKLAIIGFPSLHEEIHKLLSAGRPASNVGADITTLRKTLSQYCRVSASRIVGVQFCWHALHRRIFD